MIDGVINVYKEKGYTSHDVVAKMRGILKQKKIGHTGTLDPDAQGVLPVCLGKATKLCDSLTDETKTYEAVLLLGVETDTQDITGTIIKEQFPQVSKEQAEQVIDSFVGEYLQVPPMYSALKVGGKRLYELAREGIVIERKARSVTIYEIIIKEIDFPRITMSVTCSKGTYIRTLCHDIGQLLECGGCMESLLRTRVSRFYVEESLTLSQIEAACQDGTIETKIISIEEMFQGYKRLDVKPEFDRLLHNGNPLRLPMIHMERLIGEEEYRIYDSSGRFIGLYRYDLIKEQLTPCKMFLGG